MVADILKNIKALIIDMDGVLWRDSQPLGDLTGIFHSIKALGLKYILATNNATRTDAGLAAQFTFLKNASMNGSISPSSTDWVLPISWSVR